MRVLNVLQNSDEWFELRKGRIGGSRVGNVRTLSLVNKTTLADTIFKREAGNVDVDGLDEKEAVKAIADYKKSLGKLSQKELMGQLTREVFTRFFHDGTKIEYYRVLAERMGYADDPEEDHRARGHRLEDEAAEAAEKELGLKSFKVGMCIHDDYDEIYISPDRLIAGNPQIVDLDEDGFITNVEDVTFPAAFEIKSPGVVHHLITVYTGKIPTEYWNQVLQYFVVTDIDDLYYVSYNPLVLDRPLVIIKVERSEIEAQVRESFEEQVKVVEMLRADEEMLAF